MAGGKTTTFTEETTRIYEKLSILKNTFIGGPDQLDKLLTQHGLTRLSLRRHSTHLHRSREGRLWQ